ncbi:MAG: alkaline phosphatase family protein [Acidobacteriota bacterium]
MSKFLNSTLSSSRPKWLLTIAAALTITILFSPIAAQLSNQKTLAARSIKHVIWVWFENRDPSQINSTTAPFFTSFAAAHANFTNYFGVSHPSEPNYLAAFSGSTQGVVDDGHFSFPATTDNLAKQLTAAGRSWRLYAQGYPGNCFNGDTANGGVDGPGVAGQYVRKHNPAVSFESVTLDPALCANVQPLANFDPTVNFAMVVPNMINDMHDGTTAQGDAFLQSFVPLVTGSPDWAHTLLIVSFDEGESNVNGGGAIYTAASAPWLSSKTITAQYNHFSLLRTTEDIFGLPHLGSAATASTINEILPTTSVGDFDGDGKTDIAVYRPSDGNWFAIRSGGNGVLIENWGIPGDLATPADFDGDGKADVAVFRPSTGVWFVLRSSDHTFSITAWGSPGDKPIAADFDDDGKADDCVYRPSDGNWYVFRSSDNGVSITNWGNSTDLPVPDDYDGDGKTDVAVYRPSTGVWFVLKSTGGVQIVGWGNAGDKPMPADYDGDNKDDFAVYRPSNGTWFILPSTSINNPLIVSWGAAGDIPVPGDYDGDGRDDEAVYRSGTWIVLRSAAGPLIANWGNPGDLPVPLFYNP